MCDEQGLKRCRSADSGMKIGFDPGFKQVDRFAQLHGTGHACAALDGMQLAQHGADDGGIIRLP